MANRSGKKAKKPIQTTLGKASCQNEKEVDLSHIRKPIHTSIFGLKQVLSLFQTATEEVQNYITYECDIMYECKICRTIFRSLANFILHKRNYCRERFSHLDLLCNNENTQATECLENVQEEKSSETKPVTPERTELSQNKELTNKEVKKSLSPIIEKLKEKQEIHQLVQKVLNEDLSSQEKGDESNTLNGKESKNNDLLLEKIATNNAAVFQTVLEKFPAQQHKKSEYMMSEVMEIHGILENDEAVLGPDGKICNFKTNKINKNPVIPKGEFVCTECNLKFSTKKTLTYHIKYKHNNTRLVYVCPDCKDTFANAWCVYRHLYKIHRRTSAQIKRMREQVHNSYIRKDQEPVKKKDKIIQEKMDKTDEENQWLNNIEGDNDFQMCGGCGKRFERKAALHSHAQMCTKRIAVCNTIKENNAKKKEEEYKENKNKITKPEKAGPSEILKGSSKRKPYLLRTYKLNDKVTVYTEKVVRTQGVCDVNANCEVVPETNCDSVEVEEGREIAENMRNSSSSTEEQLSPSKVCGSPSTEKIDTEKMLNIIGITPISENLAVNEEKCPKEEFAESRSHTVTDLDSFCQNITDELDVIGQTESSPHKMTVNKENEEKSPKEEFAESRSSTVNDFDLFCQNIADELDVIGETESSPHKASRTIPLILRRRNSSKSEKRNSILDQNSKELVVANKQLDSNNTEHNLGNRDILEYENVAQLNETQSAEPESLRSPSVFKISVKNLEDLIGVSTEDHIKNTEVRETVSSNESQTGYVDVESINDINLPLPTFGEVSDTIRANVSPEKLQKKFPKSLKRKRTASFDYTRTNKSLKQTGIEGFSNKQDISFMSKASPYMDQNKLLCIPCQASYTTLPKLLWHMSAHFSWFRFQCSRCSFISFNKLDCANHARKNHNVKKRTMQSVVLPIPNWKTVLMSHDFCMLKDENDLSGKHTDEIIFGNQEEPAVTKKIDKKEQEEDGATDWSNSLFVDSGSLESEPENFADVFINHDSIKQENVGLGIDIISDNKDSFQIEVPQEIYTLDVSEIIDIVNQEEKFYVASHIKTEIVDNDEIVECCSVSAKNETDITDKCKIEMVSYEEIAPNVCDTKNENVSETEVNFKKIPNYVVNVRPTRNRTRSVKTLQDDFFYDLSKVIKLNDSSVSKPTLTKQKKTSNGSSQKNGKESVSSSSKNDTKLLRVYSKKK